MRLFSHFHAPVYHNFLKLKFVRVLLRKKKSGAMQQRNEPRFNLYPLKESRSTSIKTAIFIES
jgi:hypothetical protein